MIGFLRGLSVGGGGREVGKGRDWGGVSFEFEYSLCRREVEHGGMKWGGRVLGKKGGLVRWRWKCGKLPRWPMEGVRRKVTRVYSRRDDGRDGRMDGWMDEWEKLLRGVDDIHTA